MNYISIFVLCFRCFRCFRLFAWREGTSEVISVTKMTTTTTTSYVYRCGEANASNPIARHSMPSTSTDSHVYATWHSVSRKCGNIIILNFFRIQPNAGRHACVCLFCVRMCVCVCDGRAIFFSNN